MDILQVSPLTRLHHRCITSLGCNEDGSLLALQVGRRRINICAMSDRGMRRGKLATYVLSRPPRVWRCCCCFVRRAGVDTLFINERGRVTEMTRGGAFMRAIAIDEPANIAFCSRTDVLAVVSKGFPDILSLIRYDSGVVCATIAMRSRVRRSLRFTADGSCVQDAVAGSSSTYDVATGKRIRRVKLVGCTYGAGTSDIIMLEDGFVAATVRSVLFLLADGSVCREVVVGDGFRPWSLVYSHFLNGVIVHEKAWTGRFVLLREKWHASVRRAWIASCGHEI